tara:strand:- start:47558 stop:48061 length:504 start_codon:yes stop_codon:yes gene_type:complete
MVSVPEDSPVQFQPTTLAEITEFCNSENRFNIIVMANRPCVNWFCMKLEYENFVPGTPDNDEFQFFQIKWEEMTWFVISIPADKREVAEQVAAETGMRIADGIPTMLGPDGPSRFPIDGSNTFSIENAPDSKIYQGPEGREQAQKRADAACEAIQARHDAWLNEQGA